MGPVTWKGSSSLGLVRVDSPRLRGTAIALQLSWEHLSSSNKSISAPPRALPLFGGSSQFEEVTSGSSSDSSKMTPNTVAPKTRLHLDATAVPAASAIQGRPGGQVQQRLPRLRHREQVIRTNSSFPSSLVFTSRSGGTGSRDVSLRAVGPCRCLVAPPDWLAQRQRVGNPRLVSHLSTQGPALQHRTDLQLRRRELQPGGRFQGHGLTAA